MRDAFQLFIHPLPFIRLSQQLSIALSNLEVNDPEFLEFEEPYESIFSFILANNGFRSVEIQADLIMIPLCEKLLKSYQKHLKKNITFFDIREIEYEKEFA
jgi:hypothetical protein